MSRWRPQLEGWHAALTGNFEKNFGITTDFSRTYGGGIWPAEGEVLMTETVLDSRGFRVPRWMVRTGLAVGSGLSLFLSSLFGGLLLVHVLEKSSPGMTLLAQKVIHTIGGRALDGTLAVALLLFSQWCRGKRIRLRQKEYDDRGQEVLRDLRGDPEASVPKFYLYLRAFETTGKLHVPLYLRVRRKCVWVAQRLVTDDLESYASLAVGSVAPLIALGKPGEAIGAGRILTDEESWQQDIITLMKRSTGVLLVPSDRPGTIWEMDTLKREGLLSKVVFIMPPLTKGNYDTGVRWNAAREAMAMHGVEVPEHQDRGMLFRVDLDGKVVNAEPLMLSSTRKIRKSLKRIFKTKQRKGIYKAIVRADKRASRAAFWGWLENARQFSVFPVAILAVLMPTPKIGFDPKESWATVFDRSMTAREISEFDESYRLNASAKYQALQTSLAPQNISQLNQSLLVQGLPRLQDADLRAYYVAQGEMLARVNDKMCADIATGEAAPATRDIALTYIPSDDIRAFLHATISAILAAAEDAPVVALDKTVTAQAWQDFGLSLNGKDARRYEHISGKAAATADEKCWLLRAMWKRVETLHEPQATLWAHVLTGTSVDNSLAAPEKAAASPESHSGNQPEPPSPPASTKRSEPQRAAIVDKERLHQTAPSYAWPANQPSAPALSAPPLPPDPSKAMLERARTDLNTGRLVEPTNDCALYWARQLTQNGNPQGADVERNVLAAMGTRISGARARKNYISAIDDLNKLIAFYPGNNELVSLRSQIQNEQQREAAEAQLQKFVLQHRHLLMANNGSMVQAYCVGVLVLAPDGTARFDCFNTFDPQGRCDHVAFTGGTIKEVKFLKNGLLHVATHHMGNFDFYGDFPVMQGAYQGLRLLASR